MKINAARKNFNLEDVGADPKAFLRQLFDAAVRRAMPLHNTQAFLPDAPKGRTLVLGAGKAGGAMAHAVEACLAWSSHAMVTRQIARKVFRNVLRLWKPLIPSQIKRVLKRHSVFCL
jgi:glycerate-2-kinase